MDEQRRIASVDAVESTSTYLFRVRDRETDEEKEAILVALADGIAAWLNYCQHFTHIKLDKGSGAPLRDGEIVCANHGAYFETDTGRCTYGPCEGAYLEDVEITVADGEVYLSDDGYDFVGVGQGETDPTDLSSKSNYKF